MSYGPLNEMVRTLVSTCMSVEKQKYVVGGKS
jgi:hypothetical protein